MQESDTKVLPLAKLSNLSFDQDSELKLQNLRHHLSWIKSRSTSHRHPMGLGDTTHFTSLQHSEPPALSSSEAPKDASMELTQLLDFETWAESTLSGWSKSKMDLKAIKINLKVSESAVKTLKDLIDAYYGRASAAYEGIPDGLSVMVPRHHGASDGPGQDCEPCHNLCCSTTTRDFRWTPYLSRCWERAPTPYPSVFEGFGCFDAAAAEGIPPCRFLTASCAQDTAKTSMLWK